MPGRPHRLFPTEDSSTVHDVTTASSSSITFGNLASHVICQILIQRAMNCLPLAPRDGALLRDGQETGHGRAGSSLEVAEPLSAQEIALPVMIHLFHFSSLSFSTSSIMHDV